MTSLRNAFQWQRLLGFLPVPLFGVEDERRYIMLNGSKGNFCLDTQPGNSSVDYRALAWSSDVDHFVTVDDVEAKVFRWDVPGEPERVSVKSLELKLQSFQEYLEARTAPRERSVVAHAMRVYRGIRGRVQRGATGYTALLAFLGLLARAWEAQGRKLPSDHWPDRRAADNALEMVLAAADIEMLVDRLLERVDGNKPDVSLMVRHAAGRLFQEAHYLAYQPLQGDLFVETPAKPVAPASATLGAFFTPTPLVRTIVEQALNALDIRSHKALHVFDPACGSAEFLREAVRQLEIRGFTGQVTVTGFDISSAACAMARFVLGAEAIKWDRRLKINIENRDSLIGGKWPTEVDCCLMNPPFVSWRGMTPEQQSQVGAVLTDLRQQRPDMASAFLFLAERSLSKNGVVGAVLPASMLDGESARPLREHLGARLNMRLLARLGNQQVFADAIVDPALIVARRRGADNNRSEAATLLVWADHTAQSSERALRVLRRKSHSDEGPVSDNHYSVYTVGNFPASGTNWAPRPLRAMQIMHSVRDLPTVGDVFSVQQGTITGMNSVFILDQRALASLPERERQYFRPAVLNESIDRGILKGGAWVFYPHGEGVTPIKDERHLARVLSNYYRLWLKPNQAVLTKRARVKADCWWRLSEHRNWQVPKRRKIVSTYFGGAGSFAWDGGGSFVVVQGYGWIPKSEVEIDDLQAYALLALLTSSITDRLLSAVSNNLSGGQWNLSKRFIENMPLPNLRKVAPALLGALTNIGQQITLGQPINRRELDAHAWALYGIDPDPED